MYYSILIAIPIIILVGLYYYKKSSNKVPDIITITPDREEKDEEEEEETKEIVKEIPIDLRSLRSSCDLSRQCVCLLGHFMVKDKTGEDISRRFTPTLKSLLIILILSSVQNTNGISGDDINELLWSNKNKYAARNNRNVSLSKLRNILDKVGNISIVNLDTHWKINFGDDVLCDYHEIITHYQAMKEKIITDENQLDILLTLLFRGTLLCYERQSWLDKHKISFSTQTIDILTLLLDHPDITNENFKIKIADTLLQHDYINEHALQIKCRIFYKQGKMKQMSICYDSFCKVYANLLGIKYNRTLREVLK